MEKNKGLFSFREHPVGNFSDRKKGRKRKGGRLRQGLAMLLAAALVGGTLPANGLTVSASGREVGICKHHQEHDADCGYIPKSENGEGSPCTYECRICPIEVLIAALPEQVTEDNADDVRAQLDHILDLYRELDEGEQEEIDLSRIYALQGALDAANAPMTADGSTEQQDTDEASVTINGETLYYATLEEAFAAANGQTATITMLTDAECIKSDSKGSPLSIAGGNVTLDMNGKTLSGKGYGNYGIINVGGGSLSVRGQGTVTVFDTGLTCYKGTLTVDGIIFNLTGDGNWEANGGVHNQGGFVTLNNVKMSGASEGQVYHYSGNTTINNVTTTDSQGTQYGSTYCGVYYVGDSGTLTINGGTFDKIVVNSGNYGGVQSVAGLLGQGYTYKKQDSTWATADEMAGWEISDVTVEKIPLTINPQGDTSWYYSTQQTHMLSMNAAPVDSSDSVAYVWKNGTETLDCSEDACTVPADTPVGSYTYTCEATCDGYTLSYTFTFKIEKSGTDLADGKVKTYNGDTQTTTFNADDTITVKATPVATGTAPAKAATRLRADPTAGQMALFVGDVQVSEPVGADADGSYTMTVSATDVLLAAGGPGTEIPLTARFTANNNMADGQGTAAVNITAVAKAERDNAVIGYYGAGNLDKAFAQDSGNAEADIILLSDVARTENLQIEINCTLDLGGHIIHFTGGAALGISGDVTATIQDQSQGHQGQVISEQSNALVVNGSVTLEGGTFTSHAENCAGVKTLSAGAQLIVTNEHVVMQNTSNGGYGLIVTDAQSVRLSAGTYSGGMAAIATADITLGSMLAHSGDTRYAYFDESGTNPIAGVLSNKSLTGTVTVKACTHTGEGVCTYTHNENASTHTKTCLACGKTWDAEDCDYGEYTHNDTSHTRICKLCGYQNVEVHNIKCTAEASGTVIAVSEACKTCGYGKDLGTVTIHIPKLVYGNLTGVVTAENTLTEPVAVAGNVKNPLGETVIFSDHVIIDPPTMATLTGNALLSAGEHKIKINIVIIRDENALAECELTFNVDPAPLTADMVTLSAESTTYSGTEQKPTVTVAGLTEGTDYEVSYTRDGVVTNDFTSAGTVKITATGKGNYGGKVEKTFTIKQAESDVGTVTAETLENTLDVSQAVLSRTNQTLAGTLMLTDSTLKYGTNTYTWKFTPDNTNYKTVTGEVEVTVNDTAPPTGEISIGTNKWNSFLNTITFGQFFKKTEQVTITAQDNESGMASVSYYISDSGLTEEKVKELDNWTAGNTDKTTISISQKESCVVYAKITDNQGNMTYISSDGLLFDGTLPSITGVTDGKTYCTPQTVTVTDDNLETVTVNGKEQILSDGKFTLDVKFDTAAIVIAAEDKAGNVTKVTVNAGHSYGIEWKSDSDGHWQECAICGDKSKVSAHTEDSGTVTKPATQTETGIRIYKCSVCGYEMRTEIIEKLSPSHKHSYGTEWKSDSNGHWHECGCGAKSDSGTHTEDGGTATKPATQTETGIRIYKCSVCGYEMRTEIIEKLPESHKHSYGTEWKSDSNNHWHECDCGAKSDSGTHTEDSGTVTKPATETETGIRTYKCSVCGYEMRTEIIEKLPESHKHSYGTEWKSDSNNHWHECGCGDKSDSAAHTEDSGTVIKPATETETGIRTYKCSVCGYEMRTEEIGKLPSAPTETPTPTEPTETLTPTEPAKQPQETVTPGEVRRNSSKLDSGINMKWKGKKLVLKWTKIAGAGGYDIFAGQSGKKLSKKSLVKTVKNGKRSVSLTKIAGKKLSGKKMYSVQIKAWKYTDGKKIYIGNSRTYHIAGSENRKYTNAKKLKLKKKKYVLKKGTSARIKVTVIRQSKKKKLPPKSYGPALQYWSDNEKIATVTQGGRVKAKKKGTCYIYVTALNGVRTKIKITVK